MLPNNIPPTIAGLISAPMFPRWLYSPLSGALMQQREDSQPLEKANSDILTNLNQSEKKSQDGPTSKAVRRNVATNIVLA